MSRILITFHSIIVLFSVSISYAQRDKIEWQYSYGGSADDKLCKMISTTDGGYILGGLTYSTDGDITNSHGGGDYLIVKVDMNGKKEWSKTFGGSNLDGVNSIAETSDGYLALGYTYSNDGDFSSNHGLSDYGVVKIDKAGNTLWKKCYGGSNYDEGNFIIATSDNGFAFIGNSTSTDGDIKDHHGIAYNTDAWMAQCDSIGNIEWSLSLGGSDFDHGVGIIETSAGIIVSGYIKSKDGNISVKYGGSDAFVALVNRTGILWQRVCGGSGDDGAPNVFLDIDGLPVFTTSTVSTDFDCKENHGGTDGWVFKLDLLGNILWSHCVGTLAEDALVSGCSDSNYIYAVGNSNSSLLQDSHGQYDATIARLDRNGNTVSLEAYGGSLEDAADCIAIAPDGYPVILAESNSNDGDVAYPKGGYDYWLFKLKCYGLPVSLSLTGSLTGSLTDTIGGLVRIPLSIINGAGVSSVSFDVSYDSNLQLKGVFLNDGTRIDKSGSNGLTYVSTNLPENGNFAHADFLYLPISSIPAKVGISNFSFTHSPSLCLDLVAVDTSAVVAESGCSAEIISAFLQGQPIVKLLSVSQFAILLTARMETDLQITNSLGHFVEQSRIFGLTKIDFSSYNSGAYFLHAGNLNIKFTVTK
jgi:hypothetical protein